MSAISFAISLAIAAAAVLFYMLAADDWSVKNLAAMFLFALTLLVLPALIHA